MRRSTPSSFAAHTVVSIREKQPQLGLIVDRLSIKMTIGANGKNFINAPAGQLGGHGVAIVLHPP